MAVARSCKSRRSAAAKSGPGSSDHAQNRGSVGVRELSDMSDEPLHDVEDRMSGEDLRARRGGTRKRPTRFVGAAAGTRHGWDWEADELSADQRAELNELRTQRESLTLRVAVLEAAADASTEREKALREGLRRLADARWRQRRRLKGDLRDAGLLDR